MEFIYEIENALPKEICEKIIERFKKDEAKHQSQVGKGIVDTSVRKSTTLFISGKKTWKDVDNIINDTFNKALREYKEYLNNYMLESVSDSIFDNIQDEGYHLNEMKTGEYYNWHIDDMLAEGQRRAFSIILYLNTLEKDQGGCTEFWCGAKVRPKQGKILIFPSSWTYLHRSAQVKNSGVKYTCITWVV